MTTPYAPPPSTGSANPLQPSAAGPYVSLDAHQLGTVGDEYQRLVFPGTEEINPALVFSGPGYTAPRPPRSAAAVVALVAGLLSTFIPVAPLVAIGFGHWALHQLRTQHVSGRGMAVAGLTLGYMLLVFWVFLGLLYAANS